MGLVGVGGKSRSQGLVSDFGLGTTVQLNGHWRVATGGWPES